MNLSLAINARRNAALDKQVMNGGRLITRQHLAEEMVAGGALVVPHATDGRRITRPSGSFLEEARFTKFAMDYAEELIARATGAAT